MTITFFTAKTFYALSGIPCQVEEMKKVATIMLCMFLMFSTGFVLFDVEDEAEGRIVEQGGVMYTTHAPVRINGDLSLAGFATSGDGSPGNPWIIEGWEINGAGYLNAFYTKPHLFFVTFI